MSSHCLLSHLDDWCLGESCRLSAPCLLFQSALLDLRRSDPWELGRSTAETTDFGSQDPELVALVLVRFALDNPALLALLEGSCSVSSGAWILDRIVHGLSFTGFLGRLRRSCGLASRLRSIGLGLRSPSLRQPIFAHKTGFVSSTKCLSFVQVTLLAAIMVVVSPSEMRTPGKLGLGFS